MQSIPGQFVRSDVGLVLRAPTLLNKFVQQTMGCIHIIVSLLRVTKEKHQLLTNHSYSMDFTKETIRDFTRRFGQAVQQIESYSMDVVLQNFRRSLRPSTHFFQFLSSDSPATMEELYRRADRYSMLEDNIRVAT